MDPLTFITNRSTCSNDDDDDNDDNDDNDDVTINSNTNGKVGNNR